VGVDSDGRIICWNAAAERTFGYTSSQAAGQLLAELIVPARLRQRHLRGFSRARSEHGEQLPSQPIETWARRSDDHEFPVEISVATVRLNGAPAFVAQVRDLSSQHRSEKELARLIEEAREVKADAEGERKRLHEIFTASPHLMLVTEGAT